jgi:hypothetical protein
MTKTQGNHHHREEEEGHHEGERERERAHYVGQKLKGGNRKLLSIKVLENVR